MKKPSEFRLIGKDVTRVELPGKVNGSARYSIDVQVPNMLYGAVLRAPVEGSVPDKIDDAKAKAIAGRGPDRSVAVWRRRARRDAVGGIRGAPGARPIRDLDQNRHRLGLRQRQGHGALRRRCQEPRPRATEWSKVGDARGEMPKAASTFEAEYRCDYAYHAQMEPLNAIASVSPAGDAVEIWAARRARPPRPKRRPKLLGIARDKVKLHDMLMGGGFGRRGNRDVDFIIDAVLLSKEAGRPVKVMWTREDDVHNGRFRPISAHYLKAGLRSVRQAHRVASPHRRGPRRRPSWIRCDTRRPAARTSSRCSAPTSRAMTSRTNWSSSSTATPACAPNPLRGISFTANKFATETFLDEIALKRGIDPAEIPARAVEEDAARREGGRAGGGDGELGQEARRPWRLASRILDYSGSQVAGIAEVSVDRTNGRDQSA